MIRVTRNNYRQQTDYPRIVAAAGRILARQREISPIELFVEMGLLEPAQVARWRRAEVPYLERVVRWNLSRASRIFRILRFHAHDLNLGPSVTRYHHRQQPLRFSKSGDTPVEAAYANISG